MFPLDYVKECTHASLRNLERDTLDLQQFHVWSPQWLEENGWREAVTWLKDTGKARFVGISCNDHQPASVIPALESGLFDSVQVIYNIFDQSPEDELFTLCQQHDIGVIARVPFDEGSLTGTIRPDTSFDPDDWRNLYFTPERKKEVWERVKGLERTLGATEPLPRTALRFCLSHPAVSTVIPGMRSPRHVQENVEAASAGPLSGETLARLQSHRWVRNYYPL